MKPTLTQEAKDALIEALDSEIFEADDFCQDSLEGLQKAKEIVESFPVSDGWKQEMKDEIIKALSTAEERSEHESYEDWTCWFLSAVRIVSSVPVLPNPPTSHK